jgi:hypothetical protein
VVQKFLQNVISAGLDDYWCSKPNQSFTASVEILIGEGTIRKPLQSVYAVNCYSATGKEVIVHASANHSMSYSLSGSFRLERHGVRGN